MHYKLLFMVGVTMKEYTIRNESLSVVKNNFSFSNYSCNVLIDTMHDNKGLQYKNFRIKNSPGNIDFNFTQSLYQKSDSIQEHNILMDFISIPVNNSDILSNFFKNNGFIFNNSFENYVLYSCNDLHGIVKRVKCLVDLIMELQKATPLYDILLKNTIYLLLSDPISIINNSNEVTTNENISILYSSYQYPIHTCILNYNNLNPDSIDFNDYNQDVYAAAYTDFENSKKDFKNELKFSTTLNYLFRHNIPNKIRSQVEFIYKLTDISAIESISLKEGVLFTHNIEEVINSFDDELLFNLISITKYVIKTELDYNISKIKPSYNIDTLLGSWKIPDLLSAIYFSIFFLNPNFEIIKKCSNPTCPNYYSVLHSNKKKKYCSQQCANAVNQRKSRARRNSKTFEK